MAYKIYCDGLPLYDPIDDDLILKSPKCRLSNNTVGEASFTILSNHPYYGRLNKLLSVFEIVQDGETIFRGRMTDDSKNFQNKRQVDLEGALAYFNDSIVRPFSFPNDYLENAEYISAAKSGNVIEFFLKRIIQNHNSQVQPFQQFKLGRVTVTDPNNYLSRSDSNYKNSLEILKEKLFESSLGGFLCIRYEPDGNYVDYLSGFDTDNSQKIIFGENLLDLLVDSDASETYSAVLPCGALKEETDGSSGSRLTIGSLPDQNISDDIVKKGDTLYSKSAVANFGWIYAPVDETTWEDVTTVDTLKSRGVEFIKNHVARVRETVTITGLDLHLSVKEIEAFRIYKNVQVESAPHDKSGTFNLSGLDIDIENPENTKLTIGETVATLTKKQSKQKTNLDKTLTNYPTKTQVKSDLEKTTDWLKKYIDDAISNALANSGFATKDDIGDVEEGLGRVEDQLGKVEEEIDKVEEELGKVEDKIPTHTDDLVNNSGFVSEETVKDIVDEILSGNDNPGGDGGDTGGDDGGDDSGDSGDDTPVDNSTQSIEGSGDDRKVTYDIDETYLSDQKTVNIGDVIVQAADDSSEDKGVRFPITITSLVPIREIIIVVNRNCTLSASIGAFTNDGTTWTWLPGDGNKIYEVEITSSLTSARAEDITVITT